MILGYPVITADDVYSQIDSIERVSGAKKGTPEYRWFDLTDHVDRQTPPAFLWHTFEDNVVPVANSLSYAQALVDHNVPVSLHIYPKGWHGLSTVDTQTNNKLAEDVCHSADWLDAVKKWLNITFQ